MRPFGFHFSRAPDTAWLVLHWAVGMGCLLLLTSGCTALPPAAQVTGAPPHTGQVPEIARAATVVGTAAAREFKRMRDHTIHMNLQRLALAGAEPGFPSHANLDEALTPTLVLKRMGAAETLASYGRVLIAFTEPTDQEDRDEAIKRFLLRVKDLPVPERRLGGQDLEALAASLKGSVDSPHSGPPHAVPQLIRSSHAQIVHLCESLGKDFDPASRGSLGARFIITTERLLARADGAMESARSADERRAALNAIELAHANRVRRSTVFPNLAGALAALKATHAELYETIESGGETIETLSDLRRAVMDLQTSLELLE